MTLRRFSTKRLKRFGVRVTDKIIPGSLATEVGRRRMRIVIRVLEEVNRRLFG